MSGLASCYNQNEVTPMKDVEDILKRVETLPMEKQVELFRILEKKMAIPLQNPCRFFDDWDDPEVDKVYETR